MQLSKTSARIGEEAKQVSWQSCQLGMCFQWTHSLAPFITYRVPFGYIRAPDMIRKHLEFLVLKRASALRNWVLIVLRVLAAVFNGLWHTNRYVGRSPELGCRRQGG